MKEIRTLFKLISDISSKEFIHMLTIEIARNIIVLLGNALIYIRFISDYKNIYDGDSKCISYPNIYIIFLLQYHQSNTHHSHDERFLRISWRKALCRDGPGKS